MHGCLVSSSSPTRKAVLYAIHKCRLRSSLAGLVNVIQADFHSTDILSHTLKTGKHVDFIEFPSHAQTNCLLGVVRSCATDSRSSLKERLRTGPSLQDFISQSNMPSSDADDATQPSTEQASAVPYLENMDFHGQQRRGM